LRFETEEPGLPTWGGSDNSRETRCSYGLDHGQNECIFVFCNLISFVFFKSTGRAIASWGLAQKIFYFPTCRGLRDLFVWKSGLSRERDVCPLGGAQRG